MRREREREDREKQIIPSDDIDSDHTVMVRKRTTPPRYMMSKAMMIARKTTMCCYEACMIDDKMGVAPFCLDSYVIEKVQMKQHGR
mmetsp:Transcript_41197/g.60994  ORF Transcript_41197/g.60994 Transcript_41197/m.60994 type:complete len:86 (-) Transcript_41197:502-759(-)